MTTLAPNDFTHLHVHSEFSLLDGLGRITDLVDSAAAAGLRQPRHHRPRRALRRGRVLPGLRQQGHQADHRRRDVRRPPVDDREGGQGRRPALPPRSCSPRTTSATATSAGSSPTPTSTATTTSRGSTASTSPATARASSACRACLGGEVARALEVDDWDLAKTVAGEYGDILGKGNFFLELQDHGLPEQRALNEKLLRLAPETGLPLVVTNDLHYVHEAQADAHDVLLCVGTGNNIDTPGRMKFETRRLLAEVRRPDGRALPGPARGDPQHAG